MGYLHGSGDYRPLPIYVRPASFRLRVWDSMFRDETEAILTGSSNAAEAFDEIRNGMIHAYDYKTDGFIIRDVELNAIFEAVHARMVRHGMELTVNYFQGIGTVLCLRPFHAILA